MSTTSAVMQDDPFLMTFGMPFQSAPNALSYSQTQLAPQHHTQLAIPHLYSIPTSTPASASTTQFVSGQVSPSVPETRFNHARNGFMSIPPNTASIPPRPTP